MRRYLILTLIIIVLAGALWAAEGQRKHPVYVGVKVCANCHQGKGIRHDDLPDQFSRWLASKHATAYAVLAKPEAKKIAKLSGIPQEPQESPMCLGCHATGAHSEAWEKDQTFFTEDGVQCEKCHGPGSEYIDIAIMMDSEAAMKAGLMMPTLQDCMGCHQVKGSHVAVHKLPKLDMEKALKDIAHPTPGIAEVNQQALLDTVASNFNLTTEDLIGRRRDSDVARARQVAMYILKKQNNCSLTEIGAILGGRSPSTVSHACEKIALDAKNNPILKRKVQHIQKKIYTRQKDKAT